MPPDCIIITGMARRISVVIPNRNGSSTIGKCLEAVFRSKYDDFEVVVADDCSTDDSVKIIERYPCKLVRLPGHSGAGPTRNRAAEAADGDILFFIDADCVVLEKTLSAVARSIKDERNIVVGGTYTAVAYDDVFFSTFQAVFVNHFETKNASPDYVASHAMAISSDLFRRGGGFPEDFLPILEDVELSHRLRRLGAVMVSDPSILVRHIFNFTFWKSMKNAYRKTKYWVVYSMGNKDLFKDSGTASVELKFNVFVCFTSLFLAACSLLMNTPGIGLAALPAVFTNIWINRRLFAAYRRAKGMPYAAAAAAYYMSFYAISIGMATLSGIIEYFRDYVMPKIAKRKSSL